MENLNIPKLFRKAFIGEKTALYRELWHRAGNFDMLTNFPLHLDIELSGICNLKCASCFQNGLIQGPLGLMPIDAYKMIIDEGARKGLCAVKLQVRGESFLHPQLFECIDYAKQKGILDVQITTNGTLLTQEKIEKILTSKPDALIFSVDNHHDESIRRQEKEYSKETVEKQIHGLLNRRAEFRRTVPWVRLKTSIPVANKTTLEKTKKALQARFPLADIYIVGQLYDFRDDVDSFPDLHESYNLNPCSYLFQRLAVFWSGEVTTCCMDYNGRFSLGSILRNSIETIWHSEKMRYLRQMHVNRQRTELPICSHCHVCITPKPDHYHHTILDETKRHMADYDFDERSCGS